MADELRERVLAAVRKGLAGRLDTSKTKKPGLQGYSANSATENCVTAQAIRNTAFPNQTKSVTPLHPFSAKRDKQPEQVCEVCGAADDLWTLDTPSGSIAVHEECARFLPQLEPAEPTAAYRSVSAEPSGIGCRVTIVEIPREAGRYKRTFAHLQLRPPAYIEETRWQECIADARRFLRQWGRQAQELDWSSADLFGLIEIPESHAPTFNRLGRYDRVGLCWLLQNREIVALTATTATIRNPSTGAITVFRKHHRPAFGPAGDSLEDLK